MHTSTPDPALALWLLREARSRGTVLAILRSTSQMERVHAIASAAADAVMVTAYEGPDTLPYEPISPCPATTGRRAKALLELTVPAQPRLLLTTAAAMLARLPPPPLPPLQLRAGQTIDPANTIIALATLGYHAGETADEPGEAAWRTATADIYPAAYPHPIRLKLQTVGGETTITGLHAFDSATQRTTHALDQVTIHQASAQSLEPGAIDEAAARIASAEPDAPEPSPAPFDAEHHAAAFTLAPAAPAYTDPEIAARWQDLHEALTDAHATALAAHHANPALPYPPKPGRLALTPAQAIAALARRTALAAETAAVEIPAPHTLAALRTLLASIPAQDTAILATPGSAEALARSLTRRGYTVQAATDWQAAQRPGLHTINLPLHTGLHEGSLWLIPTEALQHHHTCASLHTDDALRPGEIVVHLDHGAARLTGLRLIDGEERVALEYADGAELLVPTDELDRVWRYGGGGAHLDRIGGQSWQTKRAALDAELAQTAQDLAKAAAARAALEAPALVPCPIAMNAFARRFAFPLSPGQRDAIEATLTDLAQPRPMDRLVCGDVGFGKTEIALRAAAAAALAGHQAIVAAPTTVLARQHLELFRRRFAGTGIRVECAIGPTTCPIIKGDFKRGEIAIMVGTQSLASLTAPKLALAIIDEEQRFGDAIKRQLAPPGRHVLVMTATPIPRTLQSALVGLRDASVIATPPARRQPTRTLVLPWDPVVIRDALLRERRRGGQSFIVCPRITDLQDIAARLAPLVPELSITQAHGRMPAPALERAISQFAAGAGDVLLATNIIEAGLDIPRANLMIVTHADRFGLAQLHQLRGRVGRGARRGTAYFLTEPGRRLAPVTTRRLATLATLTALGAGVDLAAADLDLRGAGALFGEAQAGHVGTVGTALYQHLLAQAVATQRGNPPEPPRPTIHTCLPAHIPASYVPGDAPRLALYRRLATISTRSALDEFGHELADRFGPLPGPVQALLLLQRVRLAAQVRGVTMVEAGPAAVAVTPPIAIPGGVEKNGRTLIHLAVKDPAARTQALLELLE